MYYLGALAAYFAACYLDGLFFNADQLVIVVAWIGIAGWAAVWSAQRCNANAPQP